MNQDEELSSEKDKKAEEIIRQAEKMREEIIKKAQEDAAAIMQQAHQQAQGKIKTQSSDDFRTPEDRIRRTESDEHVALVQISNAPSASPATSTAEDSSSCKKQASLHSFLTSPPSSPRNVIQHPLFSKRVQESKEMRVLKELQEKYDEQLLNQNQQQEEGVVKQKVTWAEFGKMGGMPVSIKEHQEEVEKESFNLRSISSKTG